MTATRKGPVTHGMRYSRAYTTWCDMHSRCSNPARRNFRWYGAKGITVCERWSKFESFYEDMGDPPEGHTLDRINGDLGYFKENCRWATADTQIKNRKCQKLYVYNGTEMTLPEIAIAAGVKYRTIKSRMQRSGMTLEEALNHEPGCITERGMKALKDAVIASNKRRGGVFKSSEAMK